MNKINPLHIIALLVVIVLFVFMQIRSAKEELSADSIALKNGKEIALQTTAYRNMYINKGNLKNTLKRIVQQNPGHLTLKQNAHTIDISSKELSLSELDSLMSRILNGAFKITKLQISKVDKKRASLQLEITW